MAKKFPSGRCIHCLEHFEALTSDHVIPVSWYPATTPDNFEKWQAPACKKCNRELGQIENDLLLRLGLCLDPSELRSLGIPNKALRSINPNCAKKPKDRIHREKRRKNIVRNLIPHDQIPEEAIFPNFGPIDNSQEARQSGVLVKEEDLKTLTEKLVRGTSYVLEKQYIEPKYKIDVIFAHNSPATVFIDLIKKFGTFHLLVPGITLGRAVVEEDPICCIVSIEIWGKLRLYASVEPA